MTSSVDSGLTHSPSTVSKCPRPVLQDHDADGSVTLQDARTCPQGDLDARPGLQPDQDDHGSGGQSNWYPTTSRQFQGDDSNSRGFPARDCSPGPPRYSEPTGALPAIAKGDCHAPCRRSPRSL